MIIILLLKDNKKNYALQAHFVQKNIFSFFLPQNSLYVIINY